VISLDWTNEQAHNPTPNSKTSRTIHTLMVGVLPGYCMSSDTTSQVSGKAGAVHSTPLYIAVTTVVSPTGRPQHETDLRGGWRLRRRLDCQITSVADAKKSDHCRGKRWEIDNALLGLPCERPKDPRVASH